EGCRPGLGRVAQHEAGADERQRGPRAEHEAGPAAVASGGLAEFFPAEYPRLLRAMYLVTGNRHEAEEITQDAFVRALERWDRVRHADNRAGYLYRIAVNLHRSKLRRLARGARKTAQPSPEADPFEAADDRADVAPRPDALERVRTAARRRHRRRRLAGSATALVATTAALSFAGGILREPFSPGGRSGIEQGAPGTIPVGAVSLRASIGITGKGKDEVGIVVAKAPTSG